MDTLMQVEETSLKPMESVEGITSEEQLDSAEEKVGIYKKVSKHGPVRRLKSSWLPRLREERTTGRW